MKVYFHAYEILRLTFDFQAAFKLRKNTKVVLELKFKFSLIKQFYISHVASNYYKTHFFPYLF